MGVNDILLSFECIVQITLIGHSILFYYRRIVQKVTLQNDNDAVH